MQLPKPLVELMELVILQRRTDAQAGIEEGFAGAALSAREAGQN
jgi:hypothetical protein